MYHHHLANLAASRHATVLFPKVSRKMRTPPWAKGSWREIYSLTPPPLHSGCAVIIAFLPLPCRWMKTSAGNNPRLDLCAVSAAVQRVAAFGNLGGVLSAVALESTALYSVRPRAIANPMNINVASSLNFMLEVFLLHGVTKQLHRVLPLQFSLLPSCAVCLGAHRQQRLACTIAFQPPCLLLPALHARSFGVIFYLPSHYENEQAHACIQTSLCWPALPHRGPEATGLGFSKSHLQSGASTSWLQLLPISILLFSNLLGSLVSDGPKIDAGGQRLKLVTVTSLT